MENTVFKKIYDEKLQEYKDVRDENSEYFKQYLYGVINWKIKHLVEVLPPYQQFESVLEVGCATGELIRHIPLNTSHNNRYGIDISLKNINTAKNRYPEINFLPDIFEDFIQNSGIKFDLIIFSDLLEHVPNDLEILELAGRHSRYILLNLPLEKCYEFRNRNYGINDFRGHLRAYSLKDARDLIHRAGLFEVNFSKLYYVKHAIFRKFLWNKLVMKKKFPSILWMIIKYMVELTEVFFRYKRYKSNYFVFLKRKE